MISDLSREKSIYSQKVTNIQEVGVCYVWKRRGMGCAPAHVLRTSKLMSLELAALWQFWVSLCNAALSHKCKVPSHCLANQNILQNPLAAEVLPNNWINQGQRWTRHVTLSASKLPADTELQQSPHKKLIFCISHVCPSLLQSSNTTCNNQ